VWRIKEAFILCLQFVCGRVAANGVTQPLLPEPKGASSGFVANQGP
jgi:hypothetical protein